MKTFRVLFLSLLFIFIPLLSFAKERQGEVTLQFNLNAPVDAKAEN